VRSRREERGAATVEFAIVLPLLVLFVFGIIEFGRAYNARIVLTSAVREGARAAAVGGTAITAADIEQRTRDAAPGLQVDRMTVTATRCVGASAAPNASVSASYPFTYDIPFLGSRTQNLTATGVMRCGG
jgi:Flp pilus assembly protein TadG